MLRGSPARRAEARSVSARSEEASAAGRRRATRRSRRRDSEATSQATIPPLLASFDCEPPAERKKKEKNKTVRCCNLIFSLLQRLKSDVQDVSDLKYLRGETRNIRLPGGCGHLNRGHGKDRDFIRFDPAGFMGLRARRLAQRSDRYVSGKFKDVTGFDTDGVK